MTGDSDKRCSFLLWQKNDYSRKKTLYRRNKTIE